MHKPKTIDKFKCAECGAVCGSSKSLANHRLKRHKPTTNDNFESPDCGAACGSSTSLAKHKLKQHETATGEKFKCPECGAACGSNKSLANHRLNKHKPTTNDNFESPKCGATCGSKKKLANHKLKKCKPSMKRVDPNEIKAETSNIVIQLRKGSKLLTTGEYFCKVCCKRYRSKEELQTHVSTHSKVFECTKCGLLFESQKMLAKHRKHTCLPKHRVSSSLESPKSTSIQIGGSPNLRDLPKAVEPDSRYVVDEDFRVVKPRTHHANMRMRERNLSLKYVLKHEDEFPQTASGLIITVYPLKKNPLKSFEVIFQTRLDPSLAGQFIGRNGVRSKQYFAGFNVDVDGDFITISGPNTPESNAHVREQYRKLLQIITKTNNVTNRRYATPSLKIQPRVEGR